METDYFKIANDFDARHIYYGLQFYSRDNHNSNEVIFGHLEADKLKHEWEGETLKFPNLGTEVKLTFYNIPREIKIQDTTNTKNKIWNFLHYLRDIKLTFHNIIHKYPRDTPYIHTLEMEVLGEEQARKDTVRRLEMITGITISEEFKI